MRFTDTIPPRKMPDEEKIPHTHKVIIRIWAELIDNMWIIDLRKFYDWAKENKIDIEHNVLLIGEDETSSRIMFTFWTEIDVMAFKLTWS